MVVRVKRFFGCNHKTKACNAYSSIHPPVCEEQDINLTAGLLANATYVWTGPNGFTSNDQNHVITDAEMGDAGNYILKVTVDGCESHADTIQVTVKDKPATPTITSNTPLCAEDNLQLGTTATSVTYAWTGPDGFASTTQNPTIAAATVAKQVTTIWW